MCSCFGEVSPCAFALWVCGGGGGGGGGGGELNIPLGCCLLVSSATLFAPVSLAGTSPRQRTNIEIARWPVY